MIKKFSRAVYMSIRMRQFHVCACGCGEPFTAAERIEYDHVLALHLGGEDTPSNLRALKEHHHRAVTRKQAKARGKVRRILRKAGLRTRAPNAKERAIERIKKWEGMP